jgi:hypothetical protein
MHVPMCAWIQPKCVLIHRHVSVGEGHFGEDMVRIGDSFLSHHRRSLILRYLSPQDSDFSESDPGSASSVSDLSSFDTLQIKIL